MRRLSFELPVLDAHGQGDGESSSAFAARVIRDAILTGAFEPGAVVPQTTIAEQLGMSRIPVRDALRQLESEGLVSIPTNRTARVAKLDVAEFVEVYDLREMVEPYAVRKSTTLLTDAQLDRLETLANMFDARADSPEEVLRIDREFHMLTMSAAPGLRVQRMISELQNASQHFRRAYNMLAREHARGPISAEHHGLVDALRSRDGSRAGAIALTHLQRTRALLEPLLTDHQETIP
ncbi:GntR family transcriptional regulator [Agromyces silvae]|uniref:GntR family transcriptional regulator n=1 Tax=Agromyces silvae TaxID=3388266 RepID=UPI00280B3590|nr:GntR family transcriptional regulator [Agromyces protaetiae]